jgi:hypothetical protein
MRLDDFDVHGRRDVVAGAKVPRRAEHVQEVMDLLPRVAGLFNPIY